MEIKKTKIQTNLPTSLNHKQSEKKIHINKMASNPLHPLVWQNIINRNIYKVIYKSFQAYTKQNQNPNRSQKQAMFRETGDPAYELTMTDT